MSMHSSKRILLAVVLPILLSACFPRQPTMTTRPDVNDSPWVERTVRSEASGQEYRYLHLPGPTPEAAPILLFHGGIFDNRMWLRMHELASRFEVIALEWPSESPFYSGRIEGFGDAAADFLQALGIDDLYVAGQSAGAWGAVDLISRNPQLNVRAFFIISSIMFAVTEEEVEERTGIGERALGFEPDRLRAFIQYRATRTEFEQVPGQVQQRDLFYVRPYTYYHQVFSSALNQGDRPQATGEIECPVLVLHGVEDETMPIRVAELTPGLFEDATFRRFDGFGHSMSFTHGPRVAEAMLDFVEERQLETVIRSEDHAASSDSEQ